MIALEEPHMSCTASYGPVKPVNPAAMFSGYPRASPKHETKVRLSSMYTYTFGYLCT